MKLDECWVIVARCLAGLIFFFTAGLVQAEVDDANLSRLISQGKLDQAQAELESANPTAVDRAFFRARILKATGHFPQAIDAFREVLSLSPGHVNARRELGHTLLISGQYEGASFHFSELLELESNMVMQERYREFLRQIDLNKPVGFQAFFAFVPSSNVNVGTSNSVFETTLGQFLIDPDSQAESGVGLSVGGAGYVRHRIAPDRRLVFDWQILGTTYNDEYYNSANARVSLSYQQSTARSIWSVTPYAELEWRADYSDNQVLGLRYGLNRKVSDRLYLDFNASHEIQKFPNLVYRNGGLTAMGINLRYALNPTLWVSSGIEGEIGTPNAAHLQYEGGRVFAGVAKKWQGGLFTRVRAEMGIRDFDNDYPLLNAPRDDDYVGVNLSVYNSRISYAGFTPQLNCSYMRNHSNVAFNDYSVTECRLGYSKNF